MGGRDWPSALVSHKPALGWCWMKASTYSGPRLYQHTGSGSCTANSSVCRECVPIAYRLHTRMLQTLHGCCCGIQGHNEEQRSDGVHDDSVHESTLYDECKSGLTLLVFPSKVSVASVRVRARACVRAYALCRSAGVHAMCRPARGHGHKRRRMAGWAVAWPAGQTGALARSVQAGALGWRSLAGHDAFV